MASHASVPPLLNVSESRQHANKLLLDQSNHLLAKHLLAWCEIAEGNCPETLFEELRKPSRARAEVPPELNLGWLFSQAHRSYEGLNLLSEDLDHAPENDDLKVLAGICLQRTRNHDASRKILGEVLLSSPENKVARLYYARALLSLGHWSQGFAELEKSRDDLSPTEEAFYEDPKRLWTGQDLKGKHIVIVGSESVESQLLFSRFTRELKENLEARMIGMVCSTPRLVELLRTLPYINRVDFVKFEPFDYFVPIECLPGRLGIDMDNHRIEVPHVRCSSNAVLAHRAKIRSGKPLLGICWRETKKNCLRNASLRHAEVPRSLEIGELRHLLERLSPRFDFVSLQEDPLPEELQLFAEFGGRVGNPKGIDYAQVAEWASCLDEIVTVDGPMAHLAGALGLRANVLLPYAADWTWSPKRSAVPWYPQLRLYRQRREHDWTDCLLSLERDLDRAPAPVEAELPRAG